MICAFQKSNLLFLVFYHFLFEARGSGYLSLIILEMKLLLLQVHRACVEREIISLLDHPFLPTLYTSFQVCYLSLCHDPFSNSWKLYAICVGILLCLLISSQCQSLFFQLKIIKESNGIQRIQGIKYPFLQDIKSKQSRIKVAHE